VSEVYEALATTFAKAGLSVPPVPERFRDELRQFGEWFFSTREIERGDMYTLRGLFEEALDGDVPDYLAISHSGHGVNSYVLTYALVTPSLVVMVQTPWGGAYMDRERQAAD
jgi:hypothetical protein